MPAFYPLMIAAIVLCTAAWEPFDFTLDVGTLVGRIRSLHADPWQIGAMRDEGVELVRYALFGLAASLWLRQLGVRGATMWAAVGGAALAFSLEGSQWIIESRMPGLEDASVHAAGVLAGVALSIRWPWSRSQAFWCAVLWCAIAVGAAVQMLSPFALTAARRPFMWMPFANYYEHTSFETVSHTFELILIYFPLGFALSMAGPRRRPIWMAVAATLLISAPLEFLQGRIAGRYGDITDIAVAVLGAVIGVWSAGAGLHELHRPGELPQGPTL